MAKRLSLTVLLLIIAGLLALMTGCIGLLNYDLEVTSFINNFLQHWDQEDAIKLAALYYDPAEIWTGDTYSREQIKQMYQGIFNIGDISNTQLVSKTVSINDAALTAVVVVEFSYDFYNTITSSTSACTDIYQWELFRTGGQWLLQKETCLNP